ncbi:MAG: glycosyl hydrolase, partial [Pirellulales bacterium]
MLHLRDRDGFGGVAPLTLFRMKPATEPTYLTDGYFEMYGCILDTAKELGMRVVFYDDCDFPSGTAGKRMATQYPNDLMKYLARSKTTVMGPAIAMLPVPPGRVMSVVARDLHTGERRVVTSETTLSMDALPPAGRSVGSRQPSERRARGDDIRGRHADGGLSTDNHSDEQRGTTHTADRAVPSLHWKVPAGEWEVQAFVCATAPERQFVDCLDPQAMSKFIGLTYDRFFKRFPSHFGTTVRMTFYDDLSTYHAPDCLLWTPSFNETFQKRFGRSPEALYPALWEDIGPDTSAARVSLYGLRNELFAAGYPRAVEEWCKKRGMKCSGHPAASYRANPLQSTGDAILFYKYQSVPLTDYIHYYDHGIDGFKIPASAAYNFDRSTVVCEIYGNFHQQMPNDSNMLYRAGMEVYARGINYLLPHGTWWDPDKMRIVPEISWRNPMIGPELPHYNRWAARCETLLRAGRHVADIGVLYPIEDLAARYHVGLLPFTHGKDPIPGTDYYEVSRLLTGEIRRDFTFLHPEIVDTRCRVDGNEFVLDNSDNWERYRVLILPACRTIRASNLRKIREFLGRGGHVIATTCLPQQSAEFGHDADVQRLAREMFGPGGKGCFLPKPDENSLRKVLDGLDFSWDVRIDNATDIPRKLRSARRYGGKVKQDPDWYEGGNRELATIHRSVSGAEIYFFSNASDLDVTA